MTTIRDVTPIAGMKPRDLGILAMVALVMRLIYLDHAPILDELYHVLAARSWADNGTLAIADGTYDRTGLFTMLIGSLFRFLPDTLLVARIPAVLAGTAWAVVVASWTGQQAGRVAGWTAGLLLCVDPGAIMLSQYARFYTLHGLFFFVGAALCFALVEQWQARSLRWNVTIVSIAALALLVAGYLQITTVIGVLAIGLWAAWSITSWWLVAKSGRPMLRWAPVAVVGLGIVLAGLALKTGLVAGLWSEYRWAPLWASDDISRVRYYERLLAGRYPLLLGLLPVAFLVAVSRFRRVTTYAAVLFGTALLLHSFAGAKAERYLYYVMPFFFIIWGIALEVMLPAFRTVVHRVLEAFLPPTAPGRVRSAAVWGVIALVAGIGAYYNPASYLTRHLLHPGDEDRPYDESEWGPAAPLLRRLADSTDVLVSTALPKSLYYLGGGDVALGASELYDYARQDGKPLEFAIDPRTGRPGISTPESLARVMACYGRGLVLIELFRWRVDNSVPDATADYLVHHADEVQLPPAWKLKAFRWQRDPVRPSGKCPPVHRPFAAVPGR